MEACLDEPKDWETAAWVLLQSRTATLLEALECLVSVGPRGPANPIAYH